MATKNTGPLKGVRVPVKLPWKSVALNQEQFVSMKKPVAEYLKLTAASEKELSYKGTIRYKKRDADGKPTGALLEKTVKRIRRPGYRQRSVMLIFGNKKTGAKKKVVIGNQARYSISFPVTKSVSIEEIVKEFKTGKYKDLDVIRVVDVNSGQGYPVA
jgi:hypothetical protein